ncbi:cytochrome P450 [Cryphonectria parasitica EP155]|uniref:Cytochrome P450 n=1 Tax=Cryphonectria parasitica (strain ATCC 38755 / EP155) TaxID=660469 RepID=A0A9P4XZM2_CRYP1|nr:cytochrome P450 [Cryphonectria parasitica EP155]KAF3763948.1 cytochrome P450 [Cryphonectria parasitica EP155]
MDAVQAKLRDAGPTVWLAVGAVVVAILLHLVGSKDSREPPYLDSRIPLVGHVRHLIGLYRYGARYFTTLDQEHHLGLYTLPVFTNRLYVAGSAEWSTAVNKHSSTIDLYTLSSRALSQLMGLNKESMEIVNHNLHGDRKQTAGNIIFTLKDVMLKSLAPGRDLDELNDKLLDGLSPLISNLARGTKSEKMMFWAWARQQISEVSMAAAYGEDNPVSRQPSLVEDFWQFDASAAALMAPWPAVFARKGHLARWRFINGFVDYAVRGGYKQASNLIQVRAREALATGMAVDQYGQLESNFAPGLLSNTVPATFWLISRVFEDPELLAKCRAEIDQCLEKGEDNKHVLNITRLQTQCPLFASAFLETLRTTAPLNTYRFIREDTVVTNNSTQESFLLRKGNLVQHASTVLHSRASVWGENPDSFNAGRFLPPMDPAAPFRDANGKMYSGSFRPFGGGVHLCPGRYFAQTSILAGAALFIAAYDMESEPGTGRYVPPPFKNAKGVMFLSIIKPDRDVEVSLKRRAGFENAELEFSKSR